MKVNDAWNLGYSGSGIKVAVIDEGVQLNHPDLQGNLLQGYDATGNNSNGGCINNDAHGTNCAGIIAAIDNSIGIKGIAYNSKVIPIRIAYANASGNWVTNDNWISDGINNAVSLGADILSNSWGGGSPSTLINNAINNAVQNGRNGKGAVVLFSTGNHNRQIAYPSTNTNVIAVGASSMCDTRKRSISNANDACLIASGSTPDPLGVSCDGETCWGSNYGDGLDVLAPGVRITSTDITGSNGYSSNDYYSFFNGTSAACPNAAAVVALILSANPNLTEIQARQILESTCDKISTYTYQSNVAGQPNSTWSNQAGYGRINAASAVCVASSQFLTISGPAYICTSEIFTINTNQSVTWSVTPTGIVSLNPSGNQVTITRVYDGLFTLTATINSACGVPVTRQLISGTTATPSTSIIGGIPDNYVFCVNSSFNVYSSISPFLATNWSVIGGSITSGQGTQFIGIQLDNNPGGYAIMVEYTDDCGGTRIAQLQGTKVNDNCSGSNTETSVQNKILSIYPNPVTDFININLPSNSILDQTVIKIYNTHGQLLKQQKPLSYMTKLILTEIPKGVYFIKIYSGTNHVTTKKIIKQ